MNRTARGALLDFDGTLTKPAFDWPAMKEEMGLPDGDISILDHLAALPPERARPIADILEKYERRAADRAEAGEGARELLAHLRARKIPFAVVTNNAARHVRRMAKKINVSIETLITRDMGCWKPDPRPLLAGARAIGVAPDRCVVIDDGRYDMMAAKAAGMLSVHLASSFAVPSDFTLPSLRAAPALLDRLIDA